MPAFTALSDERLRTFSGYYEPHTPRGEPIRFLDRRLGIRHVAAENGTRRVRGLTDNEHEAVIRADLDLTRAARKDALDSLEHPQFLAAPWRNVLREVRQRVAETDRRFLGHTARG
jgi:hypothetical protein